MDGAVVVGVDYFEGGDALISAAAREARLREAALWLVHACPGYASASGGPTGFTPDEAVRDAARDRLAVLADRIRAVHPDLRIHTAVLTSPAALALGEVASQTAGLVVVGGRGRGGFAGQLLGSVSLRVLAHAGCPVLVVRGEGPHTTGRVMVGVDVDDPVTGPDVLGFAFEEASRRGADLYAFFAWEDPAVLYAYGSSVYMQDQRMTALKRSRAGLDQALAPWIAKYPELRVAGEVLTGVPATLLVEATQLSDLVVVGAKRRGDGHDGMRVGALAHTLLHHAHCPVAVVPEH
jgi:nucleotide-binding universal stress UspA family protein